VIFSPVCCERGEPDGWRKGVRRGTQDWVWQGDIVARGVGRVEVALAAACITASLGISLYTIVTRTLLIPTSEWVLDLPLELVTLASLFGAGGLIASEGHIGVDFVVDWLPRRTGSLTRGAVSAFLGVVCLFLVSRGAMVTRQAAAIHLTIPEIFDLPMAIPAGVSTAAIFLWTLHFGWLAIHHWVEAFREQISSAVEEKI
jgi:TRAP-type C4-dicarboxylate transport system permease small subunit